MNNPNEDGFDFIPLIYATLTLLPLGASALVGALAGHPDGMRRARRHLIVAGCCLGVVVALEGFRRLMILMN